MSQIAQKCNLTIETIKDNRNRTDGKETCKKLQFNRKTVSKCRNNTRTLRGV